jgi:hypothetical protein
VGGTSNVFYTYKIPMNKDYRRVELDQSTSGFVSGIQVSSVASNGARVASLEGYSMYGACVHPVTGFVYFYHERVSPLGISWHVLHRWDPSNIATPPVQLGTLAENEGYLSIKASATFVQLYPPKIFIDMSGNFRLYDRSGSLYLPMPCTPCPGLNRSHPLFIYYQI